MKVDYLPCYGCTSRNPKWRGPRLGWLCLECFAENTEPVVKVLDDDGTGRFQSVPDGGAPAVVRRVGATTWMLYLYAADASEPVEILGLGNNFDAEKAVDEAKWILGKRAQPESELA